MEAQSRSATFYISSTYGSGFHATLASPDPVPSIADVAPNPPRVGAPPFTKLVNNNPFALRDVSDGLIFSEDVVRERCFHLLPYDDKYFRQAVDPRDLIPTKPKVALAQQGPLGRHNKPGPNQRHMPCIQKLKSKTRLVPIRTTANVTTSSTSSRLSCANSPSAIEPKNTVSKTTRAAKRKDGGWDEYLLSILSKNTANWIVTNKIEDEDPKKQHLDSLLHDWHGSDIDSELIHDNASEIDAQSDIPDSDLPPEKGGWRKKQEKT